jgi:hypothetical protein
VKQPTPDQRSKALSTRRENRSKRLEAVLRAMRAASDDYATAHLHGDEQRVREAFAKLRRLGRERYSLMGGASS